MPAALSLLLEVSRILKMLYVALLSSSLTLCLSDKASWPSALLVGESDLVAAAEPLPAPFITGNYESPTDMCAYKNKLPSLVIEVGRSAYFDSSELRDLIDREVQLQHLVSLKYYVVLAGFEC